MEQQATIDRPLELAPERFRDTGRAPYAIVDIGSNSVRLVVYDQLGRAPFPRFNEKSLCQLGDGFARTGALSAQGMACTTSALRRFRAIVDAMGVERVDVLATEAVRNASNGPELIERIAEHTGWRTRVLSGEQEAYYGALGVISGFYRPAGLSGDMGGGSLEMAALHDDRVGEKRVSLRLGALPVKAMLEEGEAAAKARVDALLREGLTAGFAEPVFYAVGGGWRALARVMMASRAAPVRVVHGFSVPADEARLFAKSIGKLTPAKIAVLPGLPTRRAGSLPAAALVLDRVLKRLRPERLVFSMLGVREGWLYEQLSERERYLDPLIEGAQAFGLPFARVPAFATALVRWTAPLFSTETHPEQRLRVAVCALSDYAWRDDADLRAGETYRRLLQSPLIGLEHSERVFIAASLHARYGGAAEDAILSPAISLLTAEQRRRALVLGRALQVGYRVSGGVAEMLEAAELILGEQVVRLRVRPAARVPESEVVSDRLRRLADAVGAKRVEIVEAS